MPPPALRRRALGNRRVLRRVNGVRGVIAARSRRNRVSVRPWAGVVELATPGRATEQPAKELAGSVEVAAFKVDPRIEPPQVAAVQLLICL